MLQLPDPELLVDQACGARNQEQQGEQRAAALPGVAQKAAISRIAAARSELWGRIASSSWGA